MLTSSNPPVGAIAFGRSGVPCIVTALESERVVLQCPDGASLRVPLTAIARWELPAEPTPFPVGSIVHKRYNYGWTGIVLKLIGSDAVEVLWWLDKHPTLMAVEQLRPADEAISRGYRRAFEREGVMP